VSNVIEDYSFILVGDSYTDEGASTEIDATDITALLNYEGTIAAPTDIDWYKITITTSDTSIQLDNVGGSVEIYDSTGTLLGTSYEIIPTAVGEYFVKFFNLSPTDYSFVYQIIMA